MEKVFFLNGEQSSNMKIKTGTKLYQWLEDNKYVYNDEIHISKETLEQLRDVELPKEEEIFIGNLLYHIEYNFETYVFIKKDDIYCCEHKWCITNGQCPGFDHELGGW